MAGFSRHTAAGAGLRVGGIVPQRSVSINMNVSDVFSWRATDPGSVISPNKHNA